MQNPLNCLKLLCFFLTCQNAPNFPKDGGGLFAARCRVAQKTASFFRSRCQEAAIFFLKREIYCFGECISHNMYSICVENCSRDFCDVWEWYLGGLEDGKGLVWPLPIFWIKHAWQKKKKKNWHSCSHWKRNSFDVELYTKAAHRSWDICWFHSPGGEENTPLPSFYPYRSSTRSVVILRRNHSVRWQPTFPQPLWVAPTRPFPPQSNLNIRWMYPTLPALEISVLSFAGQDDPLLARSGQPDQMWVDLYI